MSPIYHITTRAAWEAAQAAGVYRPASLASEGFIHCSTRTQIVPTANAIFRGQTGLVLLCIDPRRLSARLACEPPAEDPASEQRFPHIYGPLNVEAVLRVVDFPPGHDGSFALPEQVAVLPG